MKSKLEKLFALFVLLSWFDSSHSFVDLFLNSNETYTLIGLPGSLFYIFNGELRERSIEHQMEIPESKNFVEFDWRTYNQMVMYAFDITEPNKLSIRPSGIVPNEQSRFRLLFNCSWFLTNPNASNYMDTWFNVNFKLNQSEFLVGNETAQINFTITYRKQCRNDVHANKVANNSFVIAYIIMCTLGAFTVIILTITLIMFIKNKLKVKKIVYANPRRIHIGERLIQPTNNTINSIGNRRQQPQNTKRIQETNADIYSQDEQSVKRFRKNYNCSNNNNMNLNRKQRQLASQTGATGSNRRLRGGTDSNTCNNEGENANLYESLQESTVFNDVNERLLAKNNQKLMLNVTTNTMQSNVNNLSTATLLKANCAQVPEYNVEQVQFGRLLMEGTFAQIFEGTLRRNEIETGTDIQTDDQDEEEGSVETIKVLIKTVKKHASIEQIDLMLDEAKSFKFLKHKHLNQILGICMADSLRGPCALYKCCDYGNLKLYLSAIRNESLVDQRNTLSPQELLYLALQLIKGVNYLHSKHVLHKDIAARNCWLDENFCLKLSDCALSRDLFPNDYVCLANNENRPVYWMSIESLRQNKFNVRTDVWSCGVFIWECFTLAMQPFETIDAFDLADYLSASESNRLAKPANCPSEVYNSVMLCWQSTPSMRPSLKQLFQSLHKFYTSLNNNYV
jgi:hypothetical protein